MSSRLLDTTLVLPPALWTGHHLITPAHRSIRRYYENIAALRAQGVLNEMSVRSPFESLLQETARLKDWTFTPELSGKSGGAIIRPDGTLRDRNSLPRGYWEAKDTQDDLDTEIKKKIARGYPLSNIIFEDTQTGVLFQSKQKINGPYSLGNPIPAPAIGLGVPVSFARHGRSQVQSFPRRRESIPHAIGNAPPAGWIPAFAGMTSVPKGIPFQMTPAPAWVRTCARRWGLVR